MASRLDTNGQPKCCGPAQMLQNFSLPALFLFALSQFGILIFAPVESTSSPAANFPSQNVPTKPPKTPIFIGYLLDTFLHSSQNTACFALIEADAPGLHSVSSSRGKHSLPTRSYFISVARKEGLIMMKSHEFTSWRLCVLAALVVLLLGVAAPRLSAQINIGAGGFDTTTVCKSSNPTTGCLVQTNGSAQSAVNNQQSNVLRLTTSTGSLTASAWAATPQTVVNGFTSVFTFQFTNPSNPPADGIAFLIQNSPAALSAIGIENGNGGSIGYGADDSNQQLNQGIPNSLAIELTLT